MTTSKKPRGFAAMHPDAVKAIAKKGGKAAHAAGTAHQYTSETARAAGRKGGLSTHAKRKGVFAHVAGSEATDKKDPHRMVEVACSSASGCAGQQHADQADGDMVGELPTKGDMKPELSGTAEGDSGAPCGGKSGCGSKS